MEEVWRFLLCHFFICCCFGVVCCSSDRFPSPSFFLGVCSVRIEFEFKFRVVPDICFPKRRRRISRVISGNQICGYSEQSRCKTGGSFFFSCRCGGGGFGGLAESADAVRCSVKLTFAFVNAVSFFSFTFSLSLSLSFLARLRLMLASRDPADPGVVSDGCMYVCGCMTRDGTQGL